MTPIFAETGVTPIAIVAGVVLLVLAAISLIAVTKRKDTQDATGVLSRETLKRDRGTDITPLGEAPTGKEIERIAELERKGGAVAVATKPDLATYVPPDPDTLGV